MSWWLISVVIDVVLATSALAAEPSVCAMQPEWQEEFESLKGDLEREAHQILSEKNVLDFNEIITNLAQSNAIFGLADRKHYYVFNVFCGISSDYRSRHAALMASIQFGEKLGVVRKVPGGVQITSPGAIQVTSPQPEGVPDLQGRVTGVRGFNEIEVNKTRWIKIYGIVDRARGQQEAKHAEALVRYLKPSHNHVVCYRKAGDSFRCYSDGQDIARLALLDRLVQLAPNAPAEYRSLLAPVKTAKIEPRSAADRPVAGPQVAMTQPQTAPELGPSLGPRPPAEPLPATVRQPAAAPRPATVSPPATAPVEPAQAQPRPTPTPTPVEAVQAQQQPPPTSSPVENREGRAAALRRIPKNARAQAGA